MVFVLTAHNAVVRLCLFHSFCYANLKEIYFLLYNGHWIVYCNGIINYVATRRLDSIIILVCLLFLLLWQTKNNTRPRSIEVLSHLWGECSTPFTLNAESTQSCARTTMLQIKIENKFISHFVFQFDGNLTYSLLLIRVCATISTINTNTMYSFVNNAVHIISDSFYAIFHSFFNRSSSLSIPRTLYLLPVYDIIRWQSIQAANIVYIYFELMENNHKLTIFWNGKYSLTLGWRWHWLLWRNHLASA